MFKRVSMTDEGTVDRFGERLPYDESATDWEKSEGSEQEEENFEENH
jgi:hypothetical protein